MAQMAIQSADNSFLIETIIPDEDREQEEFVQELDTQQEVAESFNLVAGSVSTLVGGSNAPLTQQTKIDQENILKDPEMQVNVSVQDVPAVSMLGDDLGEAEVTGLEETSTNYRILTPDGRNGYIFKGTASRKP